MNQGNMRGPSRDGKYLEDEFVWQRGQHGLGESTEPKEKGLGWTDRSQLACQFFQGRC